MPNTDSKKIIIVGAGIFGVTAALELAKRGHQVKLFDPGPLPHPDAASTDISKAIRLGYGADEFYMELMEIALEGWDTWNAQWPQPLYHQDGVLFLARTAMEPGGFEYDSHKFLKDRGHNPVRINPEILKRKYPVWNADRYPDGYFNPRGGWASSGKVVAQLILDAQAAGVALHEGEGFKKLIEQDTHVTGIRTIAGEDYYAEYVIVAAGAWTPVILPYLEKVMWSTGQPVMHFKVEDIQAFQAPNFSVWGADINNTGWYGFPAKDDGTLKVANHGPGWRTDPRGERRIPDGEEQHFREFFRDAIPTLVNAPKIGERLCLYCDTWDGNFWIDHDPDRPGLIVCSGGSGHGFKFAPVLGQITADVLERRPNKFAKRFAWRTLGQLANEDARFIDR